MKSPFIPILSRLRWPVIVFALAVVAQAATVSNREPATDDIGYLPRDGTTVHTNPPALGWLPEKDAAGYSVQIARDANFSRDVITTPASRRLLYTHTAILPSGRWWWRYACVDSSGKYSAWSTVRQFTVAPDAQPFPRPSAELVHARVPSRHPRLMLRPEELAHFRAARSGAEKVRWDQLVQEAEGFLKTPLIPEAPPWTNGKWNVDEWSRNFQQATQAVTLTETLAFCYLLSGDRRYGEAACRWLLHIASWDPRGTTGIEINNEAAYPILHYTARVYDWIYELLSPADRSAVLAMAKVRGTEAYERLTELPYEQKAFHSHGGRIWHFLGEAAIAYRHELPEAEEWLDYALTIFWGPYPAYGDEEGGWAQGYTYWSAYINRSTWWLDALEAALQIDGTAKPFYRNAGAFPLHVAPPGGALTGFGDYAERRPKAESAAVVAYFARKRQRPEWQWYADAWGQGQGATGPIGFLRAARSNSPRPEGKLPENFPTARLFRGAGWASLNSNLRDGAKNVQVMLRAAPLGNGSHSHADQNAIVVGAYGSPLLVNTGVRPWYGSPFCKEWYWTTKAHNALEIDGDGQPKTWEAKGEVAAFEPGARFDYVVGDATAAYGERVTRYRRHLVFLKPEILVIFDEVTAPRPVPLKFWLHGRAPFTIDESSGRIGLEFEHAALNGFLRSPGGLKIVQTDRYPIPPEKFTPEPEWHLSAETTRPQSAARFVAVLGIARAGSTVELGNVRDEISGDTVTVAFQHAGRAVKVSFDTVRPAVRVE